MSSSGSTSSTLSPSAPSLAYTITNIYQQFGFKLTVDGARYKLWRTIFEDLCIGAKVLGHIKGTSLPKGDTDEDWYALDAKIKSWFYNTCDPDLLQIITTDKSTSKILWDNLDQFFLNNKMSRMLQLQDTFRNTKKGAMSITSFCHHLKNLADGLNDVDSPISDTELVMQILRQLPPSYSSIADVITNRVPFPSFLEAKNMLLIHESREGLSDATLDSSNSSTALYTHQMTNNNGKGKGRNIRNRNNVRGAPKGGGNATNGSVNSSNGSGTPGGNQQSSGSQTYFAPHQFGYAHPQLQHSFGYTPRPHGGYYASPFPSPQLTAPSPSQVGGPPPYGFALQPPTPLSPFPQPSLLGPPPYGGYASGPPPSSAGQQPPQFTDLATVFSSMSIQPPAQDHNYYMDSGASTHMQFNQGS